MPLFNKNLSESNKKCSKTHYSFEHKTVDCLRIKYFK